MKKTLHCSALTELHSEAIALYFMTAERKLEAENRPTPGRTVEEKCGTAEVEALLAAANRSDTKLSV